MSQASKRMRAAVFSAALLLNCGLGAARADDPPPRDFYLSMRSVASESAPSFVALATAATETQTQAYTACDGKTYYLASGDYASVQAALAGGETVQLHSVASGGQASASAIRCLVQVDQ